MKHLLALAFTSLVASQASLATVIDFNSAPNQYWINSYSESGFNIALDVAEGLGTIQESVGYWNGNGTGRLLTWTNSSNVSGFTLTKADGQAFSLNSFDFGNGYVAGNDNPYAFSITGTTTQGHTVTANVDHANLGIASYQFASNFTNLSSVTFTAFGSNNRAIFDNIAVNEVAPVPEPETYALMGMGLVGLLAARRRKAKQA